MSSILLGSKVFPLIPGFPISFLGLVVQEDLEGFLPCNITIIHLTFLYRRIVFPLLPFREAQGQSPDRHILLVSLIIKLCPLFHRFLVGCPFFQFLSWSLDRLSISYARSYLQIDLLLVTVDLFLSKPALATLSLIPKRHSRKYS